MGRQSRFIRSQIRGALSACAGADETRGTASQQSREDRKPPFNSATIDTNFWPTDRTAISHLDAPSPGTNFGIFKSALPDTSERYLSTPLFADIPADMTDEELAISRSTPAAQMGA
jgi:hypothetical protein